MRTSTLLVEHNLQRSDSPAARILLFAGGQVEKAAGLVFEGWKTQSSGATRAVIINQARSHGSSRLHGRSRAADEAGDYDPALTTSFLRTAVSDIPTRKLIKKFPGKVRAG